MYLFNLILIDKMKIKKIIVKKSWKANILVLDLPKRANTKTYNSLFIVIVKSFTEYPQALCMYMRMYTGKCLMKNWRVSRQILHFWWWQTWSVEVPWKVYHHHRPATTSKPSSMLGSSSEATATRWWYRSTKLASQADIYKVAS